MEDAPLSSELLSRQCADKNHRQNVPMKLQVQQHNSSISCSQTRMLNIIGDSEIEANKSSVYVNRFGKITIICTYSNATRSSGKQMAGTNAWRKPQTNVPINHKHRKQQHNSSILCRSNKKYWISQGLGALLDNWYPCTGTAAQPIKLHQFRRNMSIRDNSELG